MADPGSVDMDAGADIGRRIHFMEETDEISDRIFSGEDLGPQVDSAWPDHIDDQAESHTAEHQIDYPVEPVTLMMGKVDQGKGHVEEPAGIGENSKFIEGNKIVDGMVEVAIVQVQGFYKEKKGNVGQGDGKALDVSLL